MKRYTVSIVVAALSIMIAGCGMTAKMISVQSRSERADVFKEVAETEAVSPGYADVIIQANIKTHVEGYYLCESKKSAHGKETYPFLVNIDGQAALWNVAGVKHELPQYIDGRTSRDPEAGEGIKYVLNKKIRLRTGSHKVFFGLPEDDYYREVVMNIKEGEVQMLEFKPEYKYKTHPTRIPTYVKGVNHYDILFNGYPVTR